MSIDKEDLDQSLAKVIEVKTDLQVGLGQGISCGTDLGVQVRKTLVDLVMVRSDMVKVARSGLVCLGLACSMQSCYFSKWFSMLFYGTRVWERVTLTRLSKWNDNLN